MFFFSGMRLRQLTTLRWENLDFEQKTILLTVEGSKTRREWIIPMPDACVEDLENLRNRSLKLGSLAGQQVFRIQLFNPRYAGIEATPEQVSGAFRKLSDKLGERIMPHRLRHTMATEAARGENPDLKSLQYVLGHTDLRMTLEYVNPEQEQISRLFTKITL